MAFITEINHLKQNLLLPALATDLYRNDALIHPEALISKEAKIGPEVEIQAQAQIHARASVGARSFIGAYSLIAQDVIIGTKVRIQREVIACSGVMVESEVYIGPRAILTTTANPRALLGGLESEPGGDDLECILIGHGATIGAAAVITAGVRIGRFALVRPGAVVMEDVPAHGLVQGNPARLVGYACHCGRPLEVSAYDSSVLVCHRCNFSLCR